MKFWRTIAVFFGGIITGFLILTKFKKPETVINADTYIDEQNQKIGKIKQKGKGNLQDIEVTQKLTGKELRKAKREYRKAGRISRKTKD